MIKQILPSAPPCRRSPRPMGRVFWAVAILMVWVAFIPSVAQERGTPRLAEEQFKSGEQMLEAFAPVSRSSRESVVRILADGKAVALGTVVNSEGWIITKASEVRSGKLACQTPDGSEASADLVSVDEENDVALIRAGGLKVRGIEWGEGELSLGQWLITPGIETNPEAVGVVSVLPRRIFHQRAFIGVQLDLEAASPARIRVVMRGMGAEEVGLKSGDVVLSVNGEATPTAEMLMDRLRNFREGDIAELKVQRLDEEFDARVPMRIPKVERRGRGPDRETRMNRMGGELSQRADGFQLAIQHDTVLQPWQCGGPVLDLEGKAVGINIARAGRAASYALPAPLIRKIQDGFAAKSSGAPPRK